MSRRWLLSLFCLLCLIGALVFAQLTRGAAKVQKVNQSTRTVQFEDQRLSLLYACNSLSPSIGEIEEFDLPASYALTRLSVREFDAIAFAATERRTRVEPESNKCCELEAKTPRAKGIAGREETAAGVLHALARNLLLDLRNQFLTPPQQSAPHDGPLNNVNPALQTNDQLIRSGPTQAEGPLRRLVLNAGDDLCSVRIAGDVEKGFAVPLWSVVANPLWIPSPQFEIQRGVALRLPRSKVFLPASKGQ